MTSSVADATYGTGSTIPILVSFDAAVTVTGTPRLQLASGAPPVAYTSGSGTDTLTFTYTVALGESAAALDYAGTDALSLAGATIAGELGDADLTLPPPGAPGSLSGARRIAITTGTMMFAHTGAMQVFTVPDGITSIQIDAAGARGGTSTGQGGGMMILGGKGARALGTFAVTGGDQLSILVGGVGADSNCGSGGGGGSWVVKGADLLLVAGGGGGGFHCNVLGAVAGVGGGVTPEGGGGACTPNRSPAAGGANGMGGTSFYGGGGGGWLTAGTQMASGSMVAGGGAYPGAGGTPGGGYGGGGGHFTVCCGGSGGGGGYSGGSGGTSDGCAGGGGGSLNAGAQPVITGDTNAGPGEVTVTW